MRIRWCLIFLYNVFWPFNIPFLGKRKNVKMVCFDLDNTLCDSSSAEAECEVFIINKICEDINGLIYDSNHDSSKFRNSLNNPINNNSPNNNSVSNNFISNNFISNNFIINNSSNKKSGKILATIDLLKIFNNIKNSHLHKDVLPEGFSRRLWFDEMIEKLIVEKIIRISSRDLGLFKKKTIHYEDLYWKKFNQSVKLYSNTIYTLEYVKSQGLKLALITDSDGRKDVKLNRIKHLGLEKYFDYIVTGDDSGKNKPDVKNWQLLFEKSNINLHECIMIGDHPEVDLVNSKKLGMITVWTKQNISLSLKHRYVDYEILDIQEVCNLLNNFNTREK